MPYPSIVTIFTNPNPTDKLSSPSHSSIEGAQNTGLTEIQTFIGTLSSVAGTLIYDIRAATSNGGGHVQSANKGGTGQTSYTKGDLLAASSSSVLSKLAVGTDTYVLTADSSQSAGVKWAAPRSLPTTIRTTSFETAARFTTTLVSGTATFATQGLILSPTTTTTRSASVTFSVVGGSGGINYGLFLGSPTFSTSVDCSDIVAASGSGSAYVGMGTVTVDGSGHTFTTTHIGFKLLKTGGTVSLYATQGNGVSESASSALTTVVTNDKLDLIINVNGTASVDYYWRKNGGTLSSATNLTSNMPTDADASLLQFSTSNNASAFDFKITIGGASYQR